MGAVRNDHDSAPRVNVLGGKRKPYHSGYQSFSDICLCHGCHQKSKHRELCVPIERMMLFLLISIHDVKPRELILATFECFPISVKPMRRNSGGQISSSYAWNCGNGSL